MGAADWLVGGVNRLTAMSFRADSTYTDLVTKAGMTAQGCVPVTVLLSF